MADNRFFPPKPVEGQTHDSYLVDVARAFADWVNDRRPFEFILSPELVARAAIDGEAIWISMNADGTHFEARVIREADMMKVSGG